jgi:hypothetical protein
MYVIAQTATMKKPALLKILKKGGTKLLGIKPNSDMYGEGEKIEFAQRDIIIPLGEDPPYGTCYNVLIEPVHKRYLIKGWGEIYHYVKLTDAEIERTHKAFTLSLSKMRQRGLDSWHPVHTEVRNKKGKINATYRYNPKGQDGLTLRPQQGQGLRELVKVITHEGAHGIWHRIMTAAERAEWIELYDQYVSVKTVTVGDVKRMVQSIRQIEGIRQFLHESEPEEQAAANIYLGWIRNVHGMSAREVQDLVSAGRKLPIPDTHLHRSSTSTPITLYSKESAPELFAEALSSDIVGDLSDKRIKKMIADLSK